MSELYKGLNNDRIFVPKEGQRDLLYSNKESLRCPSFGINNQFISENDAIDYLAELLVATFLDRKKNHANTTTKKGSELLPSIDKGTS